MTDLLTTALRSVAENPTFLFVLLVVGVSLVLALWFTLRARYPAAAAMYAVFLAISILFSRGQDIVHHAARAYAVADQVKHGALNSYLFFGDVGLPVFYYYSAGIYILAVPFELLGFSAEMSVKLVMLAFFVAMVLTSWRLFLQITDERLPDPDRHTLSAIALLAFLSSSYIYFNIVGRNAYSESVVYGLVPAVILALRSDRLLLGLALVALQVALHPPVMPQAAVATAIGYAATGPSKGLKDLRKIALVYGGGVLLAFPAWYFAFRDRDLILGVEGLPIKFLDTFKPLAAFFNPFNSIAPGPYFFALLILAAVTFGLGTGRARVILALAAVLMFLQTTLGRPITSQIPLADMGLFIWRWKFVVIFLGILWFAVTWKAGERTLIVRLIIFLAIGHSAFEVGSMLRPSTVESSLGGEGYFARASATDEFSWGRSEFYPKYPPSPDCARIPSGPFRTVGLTDVWGGLRTDASVAIYRGPLAGVTYVFGTEEARVLGCGDTLYVLHPDPGAEMGLTLRPNVMVERPIIRMALPWLLLAMVLALAAAPAFQAQRRARQR